MSSSRKPTKTLYFQSGVNPPAHQPWHIWQQGPRSLCGVVAPITFDTEKAETVKRLAIFPPTIHTPCTRCARVLAAILAIK